MPDLPTPEDIDEASRALQLGASVAELHGGLCGWLAGGGEDTAAWPARVLADPALPAPAPGSALDGLRRATVAQLGDGEFSFELLLGDDDLPLRQRAQQSTSASGWRRGESAPQGQGAVGGKVMIARLSAMATRGCTTVCVEAPSPR